MELAYPKNLIVAHGFDNESNKTFLSLKRKGLNQILDVSIDDISVNSDTVKDLSQRDAYIAGYLAAFEGFKRERESLNTDDNE